MKLISKKSTYEISLGEVKTLIANQIGVAEEKVQLIPQYSWPTDDDYTPGYAARELTGFQIVVAGG